MWKNAYDERRAVWLVFDFFRQIYDRGVRMQKTAYVVGRYAVNICG